MEFDEIIEDNKRNIFFSKKIMQKMSQVIQFLAHKY